MEIPINITKHNTTRKEQFNKFLEELGEFDHELDYYQFKVWQKANTEVLKIVAKRVIDEGIDVCKTLQKMIGESGVIKITLTYRSSIELLKQYNISLNDVKNKESNKNIDDTIFFLLHFLAKLAEENNIDLLDCIKDNDNKNKGRGVDKKVYLSEVDISCLDEIHSVLVDDNSYDILGESLKNIINKIEK